MEAEATAAGLNAADVIFAYWVWFWFLAVPSAAFGLFLLARWALRRINKPSRMATRRKS